MDSIQMNYLRLIHVLITARIQRMGKVIVSVCLSVHTPRVPIPTLAGGGTYLGWRVPTLARGVPTSAGRYLPWPGEGGTHLDQGSIGRTCYVAGGIPLAFTQENCLLENEFDTSWQRNCSPMESVSNNSQLKQHKPHQKWSNICKIGKTSLHFSLSYNWAIYWCVKYEV